MSAFANPVFPRIDPTSNPAGSALNRISRLDYALTKNAPATPLQSTLTKLLDLKSFRFRSYKKTPGGTPLPWLHASLPPRFFVSTSAALLDPLEEANRRAQTWRVGWRRS